MTHPRLTYLPVETTCPGLACSVAVGDATFHTNRAQRVRAP